LPGDGLEHLELAELLSLIPFWQGKGPAISNRVENLRDVEIDVLLTCFSRICQCQSQSWIRKEGMLIAGVMTQCRLQQNDHLTKPEVRVECVQKSVVNARLVLLRGSKFLWLKGQAHVL